MLGHHTKTSIASTAKIAGISAVLSLAGAIVSAIVVFFQSGAAVSASERFGNKQDLNFAGSSLLTVFISLLINGLLFYHLFRFSRASRTALKHGHNILLESSLFNLASYFKICALLLILSVSLMAFAMVVIGLGGAIK